MQNQRWHMPREHCQFLVALGQATPLRPYVLEHRDNTALVAAYNSCLEQLGTFRSQHIIIVTRYIAIPAKNQKRGEERETLATRGTGGSDFMLFLKKVRDGTQSLDTIIIILLPLFLCSVVSLVPSVDCNYLID